MRVPVSPPPETVVQEGGCGLGKVFVGPGALGSGDSSLKPVYSVSGSMQMQPQGWPPTWASPEVRATWKGEGTWGQCLAGKVATAMVTQALGRPAAQAGSIYGQGPEG